MKRIYETPYALTVTLTEQDILTLSTPDGEVGTPQKISWGDMDFI